MDSSQELNTDSMQWTYGHIPHFGTSASGATIASGSSLFPTHGDSGDGQVNLGDSSLFQARCDFGGENNLLGFSSQQGNSNTPSVQAASSLGVSQNVNKESASAVGQKIGAYELDHGYLLVLKILDLNDPGTLDLYTKCVQLRENPEQSVLSMIGLGREQQGILCQIAHHLNLDYEYQRINFEARVSKETENTEPFPVPHLPEYVQGPETDFSQIYDQFLGGVLDFPVSQSNSVRPDFADWTDFQASMEFDTSTLYHTYPADSRDNSIHSGPSSMDSASSFRGRSRIRKFFSRSSSISKNSKGSFRERLYSWNIRDSSKAVLPSPGRHGRLSEGARAAMKALKEVGACWKCKIVRKKASLFTT